MIKGFFEFIKFMGVYLIFSPVVAFFILWFTAPMALIIMYFFNMDFKKALEITSLVAVVYNGVDSYREGKEKEEKPKVGS